MKTRLASVRIALTSLPSREALREILAVYGIYAVVGVVVGVSTGFLQPGVLKIEAKALLILAPLLLLRPALVEELVFRAGLLPHPAEKQSRRKIAIFSVVSLVLFVLSHPLNGLFFRHEILSTFTDPVFLGLAAGLGIVSSFAYLRSGSLWPSVWMHWASVVAWIGFFGGAEKLALPVRA